MEYIHISQAQTKPDQKSKQIKWYQFPKYDMMISLFIIQ